MLQDAVKMTLGGGAGLGLQLSISGLGAPILWSCKKIFDLYNTVLNIKELTFQTVCSLYEQTLGRSHLSTTLPMSGRMLSAAALFYFQNSKSKILHFSHNLNVTALAAVLL